jgi:hypothetical protein
VLSGPLVGEVGKLLPSGAVGLAAAVGIVGGRRGVVVARDPRDAPLPDQGDNLVGPGGVSLQVPEVVDRVHILLRVFVLKHRLQRRQVGVDVRYQGVLHGLLRLLSELLLVRKFLLDAPPDLVPYLPEDS